MSYLPRMEGENLAEHVKTVLERALERLEIGCKSKEILALYAWVKEVGPQISKVTKPLSMSEGVLNVSVKSPTWANELSMLKGRLIEKLNRALGEEVVRDIRFRIGLRSGEVLRCPGEEYMGRSDKKDMGWGDFPPFTSVEPQMIDEFCKALEDPSVRMAFLDAFNCWCRNLRKRSAFDE